MMRLFTFLALFLFTSVLLAQCPELTVTVNVETDQFPQETRWVLKDLDGNVLDERHLAGQSTHTLYSWDVCVEETRCLVFEIRDSYGDGLISENGFEVLINGVVVIENTAFSDLYAANLNCPLGAACNSGLIVTEGSYQTSFDDHWYQFIPEVTGQYEFSTCGLNNCDTKIWIYDNCTGIAYEDNKATLYFDDSFGGCGEQALLLASMEADQTYYVRIGDDNDDCSDPVNWKLTFLGEIEGCTDPNSCNYNPLATIDDGNCLEFGDPDCPQAPDLVLDQNRLRTSMYLDTYENQDNCLVAEGCLKGYGTRDIIRFSTYIANVGELDYYIGFENDQAGQFTFDNCHNHWHYDGYAEYLLFDEAGQEIPIGFKNGFCVIDLGCTTGTAQYGCTNMGISAGCYDEYWAELDCQWIDISDIPDGDYTFVARVNWDNAPDALGRYEKSHSNNWAQSCITIDRSSGSIAFLQNADCPEYVDCAGEPYGDAQIDCEGNCGGLALMGDLNDDNVLSVMDLIDYTSGVIAEDLAVTSCNDLSGDGLLDIYDVSLMASCLGFGGSHIHPDNGPHNHCKFPQNILALDEAASLEIIGGVPNEYFDVGITNVDSRLIGYQFEISGVTITNVENLIAPAEYDHSVFMDPITNMVMSYSGDSSFIERSTSVRPLVRVYYELQSSAEICIEQIVGMINTNLERVPPTIEGPCLFVTSSDIELDLAGISVIPNPTASNTVIAMEGAQRIFGWELTDIQGRNLAVTDNLKVQQINVDLSTQNAGLYFVKMRTSSGWRLVKVIKQ